MPLHNNQVTIIAGPDSIDQYNLEEIYQIAEIKVNNQPAVFGTRTVGLKSRTELDSENKPENFMGLDFEVIMKNFNIFGLGGTAEDLKPLPSVQMAAQIYQDTGMLCSTEIMLPALQLACIAKSFKFKPFLVWNSSVDQLGWHVRQMAGFAAEYGWTVGLKNGKWLGENYQEAEAENYSGATSIEKVWAGLTTYAAIAEETILIQRGCDLPGKGEYRNLPIHQTAKRTKLKTGKPLYFDPSHSLGPKMRDQIVEKTVEAMAMKIDEQNYLYDGILIEVGTAQCDTHQHITVAELENMVAQIAEFREVKCRESN